MEVCLGVECDRPKLSRAFFISSRYNLDLASFVAVHWRLRLIMNGDEERR